MPDAIWREGIGALPRTYQINQVALFAAKARVADVFVPEWLGKNRSRSGQKQLRGHFDPRDKSETASGCSRRMKNRDHRTP